MSRAKLLILFLLLVIVDQYFLYAGHCQSNKKSKTDRPSEFLVNPVNLRDGSLITLIAPREWAAVGNSLSQSLVKAHYEFSAYFGKLEPLSTFVRVVPEQSFFLSTGAPIWTNALFYKGEIFFPISESKAKDGDNLKRSAKHEYLHAVVAALSESKAPGWLDEGLAQWAEGSENPVLRPALIRYLEKNKPLPLSSLQGGFTKMPSEQVAAAYAQSLVMTLMLKENFGLKSIRLYLERLAVSQTKELAFESTFGVSEDQFNDLVQTSLKDWTLAGM